MTGPQIAIFFVLALVIGGGLGWSASEWWRG